MTDTWLNEGERCVLAPHVRDQVEAAVNNKQQLEFLDVTPEMQLASIDKYIRSEHRGDQEHGKILKTALENGAAYGREYLLRIKDPRYPQNYDELLVTTDQALFEITRSQMKRYFAYLQRGGQP